MWQQIVVGLIVAAALLHFCTRYLPAAWRRQVVYFLARRGLSEQRLARLFRTEPGCGDGCGSCGSCGTSAAPAAPQPPSPPGARRVIQIHPQR